MNTVRGKRFERELVILDGWRFVGCTFVECRLKFDGGHTSFTECAFIRPQLEFSGMAANTVELLAALGGLNQKMFTIATS